MSAGIPWEPRVARRIVVTGKVQGVAFRAHARREAARLGLAGSARNLQDGSVAIVVEGQRADVDSFIAWCHHGSPRAEVAHVQVGEIAATGLQGFEVG